MNEYYNKLIGGTICFIIEGVDMQDYIREYYREEVFLYADEKVKEGYKPDGILKRTLWVSSGEIRFREVIMKNYLRIKKQHLIKDLEYREEVLKGYHREKKINQLLYENR